MRIRGGVCQCGPIGACTDSGQNPVVTFEGDWYRGWRITSPSCSPSCPPSKGRRVEARRVELAAVRVGRYIPPRVPPPARGGILSAVPNRCHAKMVEVPNLLKRLG